MQDDYYKPTLQIQAKWARIDRPDLEAVIGAKSSPSLSEKSSSESVSYYTQGHRNYIIYNAKSNKT